jgi:hypothetical protein|tara:strand:+ start:237 stop:410 length:174 start_codon:yes stop_codon:yes gene_type:complete
MGFMIKLSLKDLIFILSVIDRSTIIGRDAPYVSDLINRLDKEKNKQEKEAGVKPPSV